MNKNIFSVVIKKLKFFLTNILLELKWFIKPWKVYIVNAKRNQIKYKWLWLSKQTISLSKNITIWNIWNIFQSKRHPFIAHTRISIWIYIAEQGMRFGWLWQFN